MKLTITFPDEIGERVRRLPDRDTFVSRVVAGALEGLSPPPAPVSSKWTELARRVEKSPVQLEDYYQKLRADMREFREDFRFKHDEAK